MLRAAANPFVHSAQRSQDSKDTAMPTTASRQFHGGHTGIVNVWSHASNEHEPAITKLHNLSLSEGSQAFEELEDIRKVERACPVCPFDQDTSKQPAVRTAHPALSAEDKSAGLPGLVVKVPPPKNIPENSYVFTQAGKNLSGFGHPALIVHQSSCGHMVYCLPLTSFGRSTLLQKYERCRNTRIKSETMTDYVAIEHHDTVPHNDFGLLPLDKPMVQQTYAHLDFGFWIEWQFLDHFCKARGPETSQCTCQRSIRGEEWRQKIRWLAAINMTERAMGLRKRSENLLRPQQPRQSPPWQPTQQQQQGSERREYPRQGQDQGVERWGPSFSDYPSQPGPQRQLQEAPPQHRHQQHHQMPWRYENNPVHQDQRAVAWGASSDDLRNAPGPQRRSRSPSRGRPQQQQQQQQLGHLGRQDGEDRPRQLNQAWRSSTNDNPSPPRWQGQWRRTSDEVATPA